MQRSVAVYPFERKGEGGLPSPSYRGRTISLAAAGTSRAAVRGGTIRIWPWGCAIYVRLP